MDRILYLWIGVSGSDIIIILSEASLIEVDMKIVDVLITSQINRSITCFENNTLHSGNMCVNLNVKLFVIILVNLCVNIYM